MNDFLVALKNLGTGDSNIVYARLDSGRHFQVRSFSAR